MKDLVTLPSFLKPPKPPTKALASLAIGVLVPVILPAVLVFGSMACGVKGAPSPVLKQDRAYIHNPKNSKDPEPKLKKKNEKKKVVESSEK